MGKEILEIILGEIDMRKPLASLPLGQKYNVTYFHVSILVDNYLLNTLRVVLLNVTFLMLQMSIFSLMSITETQDLT